MHLGSGDEGERHVYARDERVRERLQRRQPLRLVDLQDLLDKVDELTDLHLLLVLVLKVERDEAVVLVFLRVLPLLRHVLLAFFLSELGDVVVFEELWEVVVLVIVHRLLHFVLHMRRHHCPDEIVEGLKHIALLLQVVVKEPLPILAIQDHVLVRLPAKLQYLQQLVVVVLPGEDRDLDEHLDGRAGEGPHIDALIVERHRLTNFATENVVGRVLLAAHQDFGGAIVARLDVGIHLVAVEGRAAKVDEFHVVAVFDGQDVFGFQITVNQI